MTPCRDCEKRLPGCHDSCECYQEWKNKRDTAVRQMRLENQFIFGRNMVTVDSTHGSNVTSNRNCRHMYYWNKHLGKRKGVRIRRKNT